MFAPRLRGPLAIELFAAALLGLLAYCYAAYAGHLARHMITHIALMSLLAPLLALWLGERLPSVLRTNLWWATAAQAIILLAWHAPPLMRVSMASGVAGVLWNATLLALATWFWSAVLAGARTRAWATSFALLLTGKLFCLVALLLVFAPRSLYGGGAALADQQLAGLLMVSLCPLTYVLAAIWLIARWLNLQTGEDKLAPARR